MTRKPSIRLRAVLAITASLLTPSISRGATVTAPSMLTFQVTDPTQPTVATPNPFVVSFEGATIQDAYVSVAVCPLDRYFTPDLPGVLSTNVSYVSSNAVGGDPISGILFPDCWWVFIGSPYQSAGSVDIVFTLDPLPPGSPAGAYSTELYWHFTLTYGGNDS